MSRFCEHIISPFDCVLEIGPKSRHRRDVYFSSCRLVSPMNRQLEQSECSGLPGSMRNKPIISFVIPAYNEERLLAFTLRSIAAEIERARCPAEIIIVDDGSTDSTLQIAETYQALTLKHVKRYGLVKARSTGCRAATGDLIANIDADTTLPKGWLDIVLRNFSADPTLVCLSGPYVYWELSKPAQLLIVAFYRAGFFMNCLNQFFFNVGSLVQGGNFVARREALKKIDGVSNKFVFYGEDTDLGRRLSKVGNVRFTFGLWAFTSARRLSGEGIFRTGLRYAINFFWATWLRRPFSRSWRDIR